MATYNGAGFIKEQLDSFARQTLLPSELVVCDDGSTDGTREILRQFAAEAPFQVRIYRNPERLGYRDNFLHALELCKGDLVAFSDQDDVWLPEKLAVCAADFESDAVTLVTHLATLVGPGQEPLGRTWPNAPRFGAGWLTPWSALNMEFCGSVIVFRRQTADPLFGDSRLKQAFSGHDLAVGFLAAACGKVVRRQQILSLHRCHGENTSAGHEVGTASALSYIRSVQGIGGRLLAVGQWVRTHSGLASATRGNSYSGEAQELDERAEMFLDAAARLDEPLSSVLEKSSVLLRKNAAALRERSILYQDAPGRARARFCRMVLRGQYKPRDFGGLGLWSLAKDSALLFRSSRRELVANGR